MNTRYVVIFVTALTAGVAVFLTSFRQITKPVADRNEEIFNKRAILSAVGDYLGEGVQVKNLKDEQVLDIFDKQVQQVVLNLQGEEVDGMKAEDIDMAKEKKKADNEKRLPLFIFSQGGENFYILSIRGVGLWDEIWGNIALKSDLNTIAGASFDHAGETPGLGAEIKDNSNFPKSFKEKKIFNGGEFVSINVRKGGAIDQNHDVDGITGATVTSDGVTDMLYDGIKNYLPYFNSLRRQGMLVK